MKKKIVILSIMAMMVAVLVACGSSGSTPKKPDNGKTEATASEVELGAFDEYTRPVVVANDEVSIIYLISNMTDESNVRPKNQVEVECAHRGWDLQVINYESEDNFRQYMDNAINQQPTAIIVGITQSFESFQDLVKKARDAGIGVYSLDNSVIPGVISNATLDGAQAATELMEAVAADYKELKFTYFKLEMAQVITDRANAVQKYADNHPEFVCLDALDIASTGDLATGGYTLAQTWLEKYGDDLQAIICNADPPAMSAAEAIIQAGDPHGEKCFVTGVDGGSSTWEYMRNNTPLKYTYSQPFELFSHYTCEIIEDIQVAGLNPGDEDCLISEVGETLTAPGIVTTVDNVPAAGDPIHSVFDYYGEDPDAADAWYTWDDGPGIYQVQ